VKPFVQQDEGRKALRFSIRDVQSRMRLEDPDALDLEYSRTMMGFLLFRPEPQCIVMVGLGGGSLAKFCHRHLPGSCIEVVEINPHVLALRDEFQVPPDDARLRVVQGDGALFVRERGAGCDVLLVDGFDYDGQPPALSSQAFYDDCFDLLDDGGIMVVNLSSQEAQHELFVDRIRRSFFDEMLRVDSADGANCVVFACKGQPLASAQARLRHLPKSLTARALAQLQPSFNRVRAALAAGQR
jgi:spermidine synthase